MPGCDVNPVRTGERGVRLHQLAISIHEKQQTIVQAPGPMEQDLTGDPGGPWEVEPSYQIEMPLP